MNKKDEIRNMLESVDEIAVLMKKKLTAKYRAGWSGGLDPDNIENVEHKLREHVEQLIGRCPHCGHRHEEEEGQVRQAIDVANLAMMLWVIGGRKT
jgi:UDP-N-acetyl-D-mannosaminuronic acid transferase (WecB/TagA/CpsF family)